MTEHEKYEIQDIVRDIIREELILEVESKPAYGDKCCVTIKLYLQNEAFCIRAIDIQ